MRNHFVAPALTLLVVACALVGTPVHALLMQIDIMDPSGASVVTGATRDSATGLDWLDVTLTTNLSFNDVTGGAGPGVGWVNDGWRYATTSEICGLFGAGGDAIVNCPDPTGVGDFLNAPFAGALVTVLGDVSGGLGITFGLYDSSSANAGAACIGFGVQCFSAPGTHAVAIDNFFSLDFMDATTGSFLVRPVPEPGTALLMCFGLAGLAVRKRRLT